MESINTVLEALKGIHDVDRQRTIARKVALNEAYYNVGIIDLIETKAVMGSRSDRNKLILTLRTDSRGAFDVYNIDKGFFGKVLHRAHGILNGKQDQEETKYTGWSETEIHHFVMTKIDILKSLVACKLACEPKLRISQRVGNIKHALIALIDTIGT